MQARKPLAQSDPAATRCTLIPTPGTLVVLREGLDPTYIVAWISRDFGVFLIIELIRAGLVPCE